MLTGRNRVVLDLTGKQQHGGQGSRYMGVVHISTSCVKNGLAAAGVPQKLLEFKSITAAR